MHHYFAVRKTVLYLHKIESKSSYMLLIWIQFPHFQFRESDSLETNCPVLVRCHSASGPVFIFSIQFVLVTYHRKIVTSVLSKHTSSWKLLWTITNLWNCFYWVGLNHYSPQMKFFYLWILIPLHDIFPTAVGVEHIHLETTWKLLIRQLQQL